MSYSCACYLFRLLSRTEYDDEGSVEFNKLYEAFDFEMKESGDTTAYTKRIFADHIVKVFPNVKKQRISSGSTVTLFSRYNFEENSCKRPCLLHGK